MEAKATVQVLYQDYGVIEREKHLVGGKFTINISVLTLLYVPVYITLIDIIIIIYCFYYITTTAAAAAASCTAT